MLGTFCCTSCLIAFPVFFFRQEPLLIGDSDLHSLTSFTFFILSLKILDSYNWE